MVARATMVKAGSRVLTVALVCLAGAATADSYLATAATPAALPAVAVAAEARPASPLRLPTPPSAAEAPVAMVSRETMQQWLDAPEAQPDVFEQFTNSVTSSRQRYMFGISLSEYAITGIRAAMRF